jgi:hypothetical protein
LHPRSQQAAQALLNDPAASALMARLAAARQAAQAIAPVCAQFLPGFDATRPGVCDVREKTLHLLLPSGAHCAKLRQLAPRLLAALRRNGFEISEITSAVQPGRIPRPGATLRMTQAPEKGEFALQQMRQDEERDRQLDNALLFARKLALTLPNSKLGDAARSLEAICRRRIARTRDLQDLLDQKDEGKRDTQGD